MLEYGCKRCNHQWIPRLKDPIRCPLCHSKKWKEEKPIRNPDRILARKEYQKTEAFKESARKGNRKFKENHPERILAHYMVSNAIKSKKIKKSPCSVCGNITAEAHHPDYFKPLDVVWLCKDHHLEVHRGLKSA